MKYFTKSKFKLALDCPTKLYYEFHKDQYANSKLDDPFLEALAQGGFQVGALAKCYYPQGVEVFSKKHQEAYEETKELLKKDNVVIFEAALMYKNLFVRVDILEKIGNKINIIEVKSKSVDQSVFHDQIWAMNPRKKGIYEMKADWFSYIYDVAFQTHVAKLALPKIKFSSYLMCPDKRKLATVNGLNQKFVLKDKGEVEIVGEVTKAAFGEEILSRLDVSDIVEIIHSEQKTSVRFDGKGFSKGIKWLADSYTNGVRLSSEVSKACKKCEYRCEEPGKKSGFNECWKLAHGMTDEELAKPFVFDVWNYSGSKVALEDGRVLMEELLESDFGGKESLRGLSNYERQWLQVAKEIEGDPTPYIDVKGLAQEFKKFKYPLHMIDFETCMVAIPFSKGQHPYQQLAFQFSHHVINKDGTSYHADEFISSTPGEFPNFHFVRALKKALAKDEGSIFRYHRHENNVLCQIRAQLIESQEPDKKELISFIESITNKKDKEEQWTGKRDMIDLYELIVRYYFSPSMGGSNSIKYVLPAVLNESEFLKKKYSNPVYTSHNFKTHQWIKFDKDGKVLDPYKTLPPIFDQYDFETLELVMNKDDEVANGGAALTAYAMMQFTHMSEAERTKIRNALLRYCELDTQAMVMIYEYWKSLIK